MTMKEENSCKIIIDLCGGTGSWSRPYADAGYEVHVITLPDFDLMETTFTATDIHFSGKFRTRIIPKSKVYGILAAPTCTMFSMARTVARTPRDLRGAMELVQMCLNIVWECQYSGSRLSFWALENPKARLRWFMGIPALTFNPFDYGDAYRKPTDIWGNFNCELERNPIKLNALQRRQSRLNSQEMEKLPENYVLPEGFSRRAAQRSMTYGGFAKAFYKANR